jgi:hypothetical protein
MTIGFITKPPEPLYLITIGFTKKTAKTALSDNYRLNQKTVTPTILNENRLIPQDRNNRFIRLKSALHAK